MVSIIYQFMGNERLSQINGLDIKVYESVKDRSRNILDLQIGDRCNFRCTYCFTGAGNEVRTLAGQYEEATGRKAKLLTSDDHKSILDTAARTGVKNLVISSEGENTLYEAQLLEVISYARELGLSVAMFTNGTKVDDRLARILNSHSVSIIGKLNSLDPRKNSEISVRKGKRYSYSGLNGQVVPDYIHRLHDAGFTSENFALNVVVTSVNAGELTDFWNWARDSSTGLTPMAEFLEPTGFVTANQKISDAEIARLKREIRKIDLAIGRHYDELPEEARLLDVRYLINPKIIVVDSRGFVKDLAASFTLDSVLGHVNDVDLEAMLNR